MAHLYYTPPRRWHVRVSDFDAMPILADALQHTGCDLAKALEHCHVPGPHVRGCWAADLVLWKKYEPLES